ncbi:MAG: DNA gyrase inhibitor YacG [Pseudomonadota bacterium]
MIEVECPTCGARVKWTPESRWRPFCSERCKLIDLGEWFDEERRIPGDPVAPPDTPDPTSEG